MKYKEHVEKWEKIYGDFPKVIAFNDKQLEEELERMNCKKEDLVGLFGGVALRKQDLPKWEAMVKERNEEQKRLMDEDDEFVVDMFEYEMGNHEYCYTGDDIEVLSACGVRLDGDERLSRLYKKARENYTAWCNENDIW